MTKVFIQTYGCTLNFSDSEAMCGLLNDMGFEIVDNPRVAEVVVINTCTVKQPTEKRFFRYLDEIEQMGKPVVITGCLAQTSPEKLEKYALLGPDNIDQIVPVIEEAMHNNPHKELDRQKLEKLSLPRVRRNPIVEIIPLCSGCLGECSYCIVKNARGTLKSYKADLIVDAARRAVADGVKQVWLTAQDAGCYGTDIRTSLPSLLKRLLKIDGDFKIRLGMLNPDHAVDFKNELADIMMHEKMFRFLHIPVQSGNDRILKRMKRKYSARQFIELVEFLNSRIENLTLATDVICGFPGETDDEFSDTVELVKKTRPDALNISKFWKRPGTPAARMKQTDGKDIKDRSRLITSVFEWEAFEKNKRWRNWEGRVVISEPGKNDTWVGRNFAYKPVVLEGNYEIGDEVDVKVFEATTYDLRAIRLK